MAISVTGGAEGRTGGAWLLLAAAAGCLTLATLAPQPQMRLGALVAGLTFVLLVFVLRAAALVQRQGDRQTERRLAGLLAQDAAPCFTTDAEGQIRFRNAAALARFPGADGGTLGGALQDHFATPGAGPSSLACRCSPRTRLA